MLVANKDCPSLVGGRLLSQLNIATVLKYIQLLVLLDMRQKLLD